MVQTSPCSGHLVFDHGPDDATCEFGAACPAADLLPNQAAYVEAHDPAKALPEWLVGDDDEFSVDD